VRNRTPSVALLTVTPALPRIPGCTNMQLWITHHYVKCYKHVILAQYLCTLPGLHVHHSTLLIYTSLRSASKIFGLYLYNSLFCVFRFVIAPRNRLWPLPKTYIPILNHNHTTYFIRSCITRSAVKLLQNKPAKRNTSTTIFSTE
jgi:hypothetical protein